MTARISTRSQRQAMDWSLALISQGIESTIDNAPDLGWGLVISEQDHSRALETVQRYEAENPRWPWRQEIHQSVLFDWGSLAWVGLMSVFFLLQTWYPSIRDAGMMDARAVSHGEWWRLFTAVFLHGDLAHLAANVSLGFLLLGLTMGRYGTGIGALAAFVAGAGANLVTWLAFKTHLSLGASGMVMGCVGLLAAQTFSSRQEPNAWKYGVSGFAGGIMLFVLLGLDPSSDVLAHFGGFVWGAALGAALLRFPKHTSAGAVNVVAGAVFSLLTIIAWWMALR